MQTFRAGSSTIYVKGIIPGLSDQIAVVRTTYHKTNPNVLCLPIDADELDGMRLIAKGDEDEYFLRHEEELFIHHLGKYGEVRVPMPAYAVAIDLCDEDKIPIKPLSMSEEEFADLYIETISTMSLIRYSLLLKKLKKKKFRAKTAEDFVFEWHKALNRLKDTRKLEGMHQRYMAGKVGDLINNHQRILVLAELQKVEKFCDLLMEEVKAK